MRIGGKTLDRSIVASLGKKPLEAGAKARVLGADLLELRLDLLNGDLRANLKNLKKTGLPVIITNRMRHEGGAWDGSEEDRIGTLVSLLPLADAVDIELCADKRDAVIKEARSCGKTVIVSTHDFQNTPERDVMMGIIDESFKAGADVAKIAVMPDSYDDVLRLLDVTLHAKGYVCTIAMGDIGRHSRVIAPIYGSVMTYGYVEEPTAPGQLRVDELKEIIRKL